MKRLQLVIAIAVVAAAVYAFKAGFFSGDSGSGDIGESNPVPVVPELGNKLADLIPTLDAARGEDDLVVIVPSDSVKQLAKDLENKKVRIRVLNAQKRNPQYYVNQIIPRLRKEVSNMVWLVFDNRDAGVVDSLNDYFLSMHRVAFEREFEHLTLVKVLNELPGAVEEEKHIALVPVISQRGGTITNIVFTRSGDVMLYSAKHGVVRWRSMTSDKNGLTLRIPQAKKGVAGLFGGGEAGLVGLALHPSFDTNRKLYTHYNYQDAEGKRKAVLSEWQVDDEFAASNERVILEIPQPRTDHNGGQLVFGPDDGYLYMGVGDGGEGKHTIGRSPAHTYRGKVLRIDVDVRTGDMEYGIPADNPFVGKEGIPPETYAWGFRNPWRMSFAPDGRLIAGDIGEDVNEELTFVVKGKHHGWPYFEGSYSRNPWAFGSEQPQPTLVPYGRKLGMSVIGGYAYRGDTVEALRGKYVFCDFISGRVWAITLPDTSTSLTIADATQLGRWPMLFTTFGEDPQGNIYLGTNTGRMYRLDNLAAATAPEANGGDKLMNDSTLRGMFATDFAGPERDAATAAQIALGRQLYSDQRLSSSGNVSCATCHPLDNYGQDGKRVSVAADGKEARRNTPPTFNAQRQYAQLWDSRAKTVEEAAMAMLVEEHGLGDEAGIRTTLQSIEEYGAAFAKAYPGDDDPVTAEHATSALGAFVRQLTTRSRWDDYLDGDDNALSDAEKRGLSSFVSVGCITCHQFRGLGGSMAHKLGLLKPWTGKDRGRGEISNSKSEDYYFKVPPLFNIAKTAPYLHDGSIKTLEESIRVMADIQLGRKLTDAQTRSIATFLETLTGK